MKPYLRRDASWRTLSEPHFRLNRLNNTLLSNLLSKEVPLLL